eukprot:TRINITY_DN51401_c0_g1_i1.p2 TRINITY_DN51401_c0_g1~~TRINITY_DN51401_c0_g1_i1.p2  ORF type:complete len:108 (-),score=17.76 TRINITY_DN51401_c0_g1_i1:12-335(-)
MSTHEKTMSASTTNENIVSKQVELSLSSTIIRLLSDAVIFSCASADISLALMNPDIIVTFLAAMGTLSSVPPLVIREKTLVGEPTPPRSSSLLIFVGWKNTAFERCR